MLKEREKLTNNPLNCSEKPWSIKTLKIGKLQAYARPITQRVVKTIYASIFHTKWKFDKTSLNMFLYVI